MVDVLQRLRQEYMSARAAFEAGDGDPDVLIYRLAAAERAYDQALRAAKEAQGLPSRQQAVVWPWLAREARS